MSEWEYRKIDLNQRELVGITSNHIAYLKRELVEPASLFGDARHRHAAPGRDRKSCHRGARGR